MYNLKKQYSNIIIYNLINNINYKNIFQIPNINKITLNIGLKNSNIEKKKIISIIILLKLITNQAVLLTKSKKNKIILKIKKGNIVGCKITLRKNNLYNFLEKLIIFIFPNLKKFKIENIKNNTIFNFQIKNILQFFELEKEFIKFQNIPPIDISIQIKNIFLKKQLLLLLNYYKFNFNNN